MDITINSNYLLKSINNQHTTNNVVPVASTRPKLNYLHKDTVTFGSTIPKVMDLSGGIEKINFEVVKQAAQQAVQPQAELLRLIRQRLAPLQASETKPNNPILPGKSGIHGTPKSAAGLWEKALAGGLTTLNQVKSIGDAVRLRIVLRDATPKDLDNIFEIFGQMVKADELTIFEVENYRLTPKQGYVSSKTLDKFEETCASVGLYPDIKNKINPKGYTAIHLNAFLPDGWVSEIQIMGRDMEIAKEVEDFYYKILTCNKHLNKKYKDIETVIKRKLNKLTDFQRQTLDQYIKDSYIHALGLTPKDYKKKISSKDFLPLPYSLPQELSYENLYKMKLKCDREAAKKNTKKAKP